MPPVPDSEDMKEESLKQIEFPCRKEASQVIGLLHGERGVSLIEALLVAFVLAIMIVTIYIGAVYAEKQVRQNYRHRVATLIASGEVEKHYVSYLKNGFMPVTNSYDVVMDDTEDSKINARVSITKGQAVEYNVAKQYPYTYVSAEVRWLDPDTQKVHTVKVREDFYAVEGTSN